MSDTLKGITVMVVGVALLTANDAISKYLWAALIGFLVWRELPDAWVWDGSAVIIASGIYMVRAEARPVRPS